MALDVPPTMILIQKILHFGKSGKKLVLLHGFIKKTAKTPIRETETAQRRMEDLVDLKAAGLTQAELAARIGTKQPALSKIAHALNAELVIKVQPLEKKA
jgi:hypothetical protein